MCDSRVSGVEALALGDFLRRDAKLDQRGQARLRYNIEDRGGLLFAENESSSVSCLENVEAAAESELLIEIEGGSDIVQAHRLEEELLTESGKKFAVRNYNP